MPAPGDIQMNQESIYSKIIKQFRDETKMSQLEISKMLGVTQATISRIEKNLVVPGDLLADKIRKLPLKNSNNTVLIENVDYEINLNKQLKNYFIKPFDVSFISFSYSKNSGDMFALKKISPERNLLVLADCAGHGEDVGKMTFAIRFALECYLHSFSDKAVTNQSFHSIIGAAVQDTHESWLNPPAIVSLILDSTNGEAKILNSMQPRPIVFQNNLIGELSGGSNESTSRVDSLLMKPGVSILIYSDGLSEMYEDEESLKNRFLKSAKAFKGDSKSILVHLLNGAKGVSKSGHINSSQIADDVSVVVISRGRD